MTARHLLCVAVSAWNLAGFISLAADEPATDRRPNVLLIVADDLNRMLGCYGDPLAKTPNLDRLAARGMRFERAYCTFPLCGPSRNSFLTGLYPNTTGILTNAQIFRQSIPDHVSLPQAFRLAGSFAGRIGKLYHYNVPRSVGTDGHDDPASWELELNPAGCDRLEEEPEIFSLKKGQFGATLSWYASPKSDPYHTDGMIARDAAWVLERSARDRSRPFFLAVGFFRPHTPYVAPREPYFGWHPAETMPVVTGVEEDERDLPAAAIATRKKEEQAMSDDLRRQCRQAYAASISFMDAQVGHVIDALDRLGLADDTVIVFTSDHGYHMGEHGLWQKRSLFEESAGVPLVIVAPGVTKPGSVAATPVSQVDLYPTLAELCDVPAPNNLQGQSLVPILRDPVQPGRGWALTQVARSGKKGGFFGYALSTPQYRYIEWNEGRAGRELYDHQADPRELTNRAELPEHADTVAELSRLLRDAVARTFPPGGKSPEVKPGGWEIMLKR
jgi:arylsulfatase A-like enzyme